MDYNTIFCTFLYILKYSNALIDITSTYYNIINEGITSVMGPDIWPTTACNSPSCDTFNLSYNNFVYTNLSAIDFRLNNSDEFENRVKHLDLSHNNITDVSLEIFTTAVQADPVWTLITIDLSYNQISDVSNFPTLSVGNLRQLFLQHNQITHLGTPSPNAFIKLYTSVITELNLENNLMTEMPSLDSGSSTVSTAAINVKNNKISQVDFTSCPPLGCGLWYLQITDFENNELSSVIAAQILQEGWDTEFFNFNNNKITHISVIQSPGHYYNVKELYFNDNDIVSMDMTAFDLFDKLQILELKNNKIAAFPFTNIFDTTKLPQLITVDLKYNNLTSVDDRTSDFPRTPPQLLQMDLRGEE